MDETMGLYSTMRRASEMDHIDNIIQVGARGIASGHSSDFDDAVKWGVKFFTGMDVFRHGLDPVLEQNSAGSNVILCIDFDAMDPSIAPNTIGRAPRGLSYYQRRWSRQPRGLSRRWRGIGHVCCVNVRLPFYLRQSRCAGGGIGV